MFLLFLVAKHFLFSANQLGETCYVNCVLQCLAHTLPLRKYFLTQSNVNHDVLDHSKSSAFHELMTAMWNDDGEILDTNHFIHVHKFENKLQDADQSYDKLSEFLTGNEVANGIKTIFTENIEFLQYDGIKHIPANRLMVYLPLEKEIVFSPLKNLIVNNRTMKISQFGHAPNILVILLGRNHGEDDNGYINRTNVIATFDVDNMSWEIEDKKVSYSCYAVINHEDKDGLHYTTVARNGKDGKWFKYDDVAVKEVTEDSVVSLENYMLFF